VIKVFHARLKRTHAPTITFQFSYLLAVINKLPHIKIIWLFCYLVFSHGIAFAADSTESPISNRRQQEDDIRETIFRYQFAENGVQAAEVYFLSVPTGKEKGDIFNASRNPSDEFVERFANLKPPVKKASASRFGGPSGWVVDKQSGKRGVLFNTGSIQWISETEVEVEGSFYAGMLYARGYTYTVKKAEGKWKVTKSKQTWLS
jgi:hypothetical protein